MKNLFAILLSAFVFFSCAKEKQDSNGDGNEPSTDYSWMNGNLAVKVTNDAQDNSRTEAIDGTKAQSEATHIKTPANLTASCIAFLNNTLLVASYHHPDQTMGGRLELISLDEAGQVQGVVSAVDFADARVNNIITDESGRVFAAMDSNKGPYIALFNVSGNKFVETSAVNTVLLNGESANGMCLVNEGGVQYLYSTSGGDGVANQENTDNPLKDLIFDGKPVSRKEYLANPGFQKIRVDGSNMTLVFAQGDPSFRAKWITSTNNQLLALYAYQITSPGGITSNNMNVRYYNALPKNNFTENIALNQTPALLTWKYNSLSNGKNQCKLIERNDEKFAFICGGGRGLHIFKIAPMGESSDSKLDFLIYGYYGGGNLDRIDTHAVSVDVDDNNIFLAADQFGVRVLSKDLSGVNNPVVFVKYFKAPAITLEGGLTKRASANFVLQQGENLYIAYGEYGVVSVKKNAENMYRTDTGN